MNFYAKNILVEKVYKEFLWAIGSGAGQKSSGSATLIPTQYGCLVCNFGKQVFPLNSRTGNVS
jgi:hypothetical protein